MVLRTRPISYGKRSLPETKKENISLCPTGVKSFGFLQAFAHRIYELQNYQGARERQRKTSETEAGSKHTVVIGTRRSDTLVPRALLCNIVLSSIVQNRSNAKFLHFHQNWRELLRSLSPAEMTEKGATNLHA